jgi:hypothetical protein
MGAARKRGPADQVDGDGGAFNSITRITGPVLCSIASSSIRQARTHLQGWPPYRLLHDSPPISGRLANAADVPIAHSACAIAAALCSMRTASPRVLVCSSLAKPLTSTGKQQHKRACPLQDNDFSWRQCCIPSTCLLPKAVVYQYPAAHPSVAQTD